MTSLTYYDFYSKPSDQQPSFQSMFFNIIHLFTLMQLLNSLWRSFFITEDASSSKEPDYTTGIILSKDGTCCLFLLTSYTSIHWIILDSFQQTLPKQKFFTSSGAVNCEKNSYTTYSLLLCQEVILIKVMWFWEKYIFFLCSSDGNLKEWLKRRGVAKIEISPIKRFCFL